MTLFAALCAIILCAVCLARWAEHRDRTWLDVLAEMIEGRR